MTCNLVKEVVTLKGDKGKKPRKINNYYLELPNGARISIQPSSYNTENEKDTKKKEKLEKRNYANFVLLDTFATIVKTSTKVDSDKTDGDKDIDIPDSNLPF